MTISKIRDALAAGCEAAGLNCTGYITDDVSTPAAVIARGFIEYDQTMGRGLDQTTWTIRVYTERTDEVGGQAFLDDLCDPDSDVCLKDALETAAVATAAGVHYVRVRTAGEVEVSTFGSINYLSVEFELEVVSNG